jgi:threonine dehydrogenase-like Zn-dependent dehydrogenase
MTRILYTDGNGKFIEGQWRRPALQPDEIAVRSIFTGVCRSDVDMMTGDFPKLPMHMSGHEGLGQIIELGRNVTHVKVGDYVATRGEPAYADEYNVKPKQFVTVPTAQPKFILEPVACGVNVVLQAQATIDHKKCVRERLRVLIMGSGFLSWVAHHTMKTLNPSFEITVIGSSNRNLWGSVLQDRTEGEYDVIIDLVGRDYNEVANEAILINAVAKSSSVDHEDMLLWKACTTIRPSPRTELFYDAMLLAREWVSNGSLVVQQFWSKQYDRDDEWQQAFEDAVNRPNGYSRGYIKWR